MLGTLAAAVLTPEHPLSRCCCTQESNPCHQGSASGHLTTSAEAHMSEILDSTPTVPSSVELLVDSRISYHIPGYLPRGPLGGEVPTYNTSEHEELKGAPLYSGTILQLRLGESMHEMHLALHVNGFSLKPVDATEKGIPEPVNRAWSPFSLIEKCQVKTMQHAAFWAVFKLTVFRSDGADRFFYFATSGSEAHKERDRWVEEIANAVSLVTLSLFPPHAINVRPLPGVRSTSTRIMAGYLLQSGVDDIVSLIYCELHAFSGGEARLAIYKDEWCEQEVTSLFLSDTSVVSTRKGAYCTIFGVDEHRFCARTRDEKDLWLRAVSNIKVKLMFDAPDPTMDELAVFRAAVLERISTLSDNQEKADPLLTPVARLPPSSPRGDVWQPEPIDENTDPGTISPVPSGEDMTEGEHVDVARLHARYGAVDTMARKEVMERAVQRTDAHRELHSDASPGLEAGQSRWAAQLPQGGGAAARTLSPATPRDDHEPKGEPEEVLEPRCDRASSVQPHKELLCGVVDGCVPRKQLPLIS